MSSTLILDGKMSFFHLRLRKEYGRDSQMQILSRRKVDRPVLADVERLPNLEVQAVSGSVRQGLQGEEPRAEEGGRPRALPPEQGHASELVPPKDVRDFSRGLQPAPGRTGWFVQDLWEPTFRKGDRRSASRRSRPCDRSLSGTSLQQLQSRSGESARFSRVASEGC